MQTIVDIMKTILQAVAVFFILEVCGKAFLKHTLIGRLVFKLMKDVFKTAKWGAKGGIKVLKVLVKEGKATYKSANKAISKYVEGRASKVKEPAIEGNTKIVSLADYVKKHKTS